MTRPASPRRFQPAGTVGEDGYYIERPCDQELYSALSRLEYCHVLAPRQIGKSSLRVRTLKRLRATGVRCVDFDLGRYGVDCPAEPWFYGLIDVLARELALPDPQPFWDFHVRLSAVARWSRYLREVALPASSGPVAIFIDEIDVLHGRAFAADFLSSIRALHNDRATDPRCGRVTFCLIGVAAPSELIADPLRTPFNVSREIAIRDFTTDEAAGLAVGLERFGGQQALDSILAWTDGHPYMTQRLCWALSEDPDVIGSVFARVQTLVQRDFLERGIREANLGEAARRFDQDGRQVGEKLLLYRQIWSGQRVPLQPHDPAQVELMLSGLIKEQSDADGARLVVRNRVFREVFGRTWMQQKGAGWLFSEIITQWRTSGRTADYALRGQALQDALAQRSQGVAPLDPEAEAFLEFSQKVRAEEARQWEAAEKSRLRTRQLYGAIFGLLTLGVVAAYTWWQSEQAVAAQMKEKAARKLAVDAQRNELHEKLEAQRARNEARRAAEQAITERNTAREMAARAEAAAQKAKRERDKAIAAEWRATHAERSATALQDKARLSLRNIKQGDFGGAAVALSDIAQAAPPTLPKTRGLGPAQLLGKLPEPPTGKRTGDAAELQMRIEALDKQGDKSPEALYQRALLHYQYVVSSQPELAVAERGFARGIELLKEATERDPNNLKYQHELAAAYSRSADLAAQGRPEDSGRALAYWRSAFQKMEQVHSLQPADEKVGYELAIIGSRYAGAMAPGREKQQIWLKVIEALQQLHRLRPDHRQYQYDLSVAHDSLARTYGDSVPPDFAKGEAAVRKAMQLSEPLLEQEPDNRHVLFLVCIEHGRLASILAESNPKEAKRLLARALNLVQGLSTRFPNDSQILSAHAEIVKVSAKLASEMAEGPAADQSRRKEIDLREQLVKLDPNNRAQQLELADARAALAVQLQSQGEFAASHLVLIKNRERLQQLRNQHAGDPVAERALSVTLSLDAKVRLGLDELLEAERLLREAMEHIARACNSPDAPPEWALDQAVVQLDLSEALMNQGKTDAAADVLRQARQILERVADSGAAVGEPERLRSLQMFAFWRDADLAAKRNLWKEATVAYRSALSLLDILNASAQRAARDDLGMERLALLRNLTQAELQLRDLEAAAATCHRAIEVASSTPMLPDGPCRHHPVAGVWDSCLQVAATRGDQAEEEALAVRILALGKQTMSEDPQQVDHQMIYLTGLYRVAGVAYDRKRWAEAALAYKQNAELALPMVDARPGSGWVREMLTTSARLVGEALRSLGRPAEAIPLMQRVLDALAMNSPHTADAFREQNKLTIAIGTLMHESEQWDQCLALLPKQRSLLESWARLEPTNEPVQLELASTFLRQGNVHRQLGQWEESAQSFHRAADAFAALANRSQNPLPAQRRLVWVHVMATAAILEQGQWSTAKASAAKAISMAQHLLAAQPDDAALRHSRGLAARLLGDAASMQDAGQGARDAYQSAIEDLSLAVKLSPGEIESHYQLCIAYFKSITLAAQELRWDAFRALRDLGVQTATRSVAAFPKDRKLSGLLGALTLQRADMDRQHGTCSTALPDYRNAIARLLRDGVAVHGFELSSELADAYAHFADCAETRQDAAAAREALTGALAYQLELIRRRPEEAALAHHLAELHLRFVTVCQRAGDGACVASHIRDAGELLNQFHPAGPFKPDEASERLKAKLTALRAH